MLSRLNLLQRPLTSRAAIYTSISKKSPNNQFRSWNPRFYSTDFSVAFIKEDGRELEIDSVDKAVTLAKGLKGGLGCIWDDNEIYHKLAPPFKYPFGLWFRGHPSSYYELIPSVFRKEDETGNQFYQDETSIVRLFQLTRPEYSRDHQRTFEWLSLMQHYRSPTRLLDWSESIFTGLYFAVSPSHDKQDGALWILYAARLNKITSLYNIGGIASPTRFDVVIRAEMSLLNDIDQLSRRHIVNDCDEIDAPADENEMKKLFQDFKKSNEFREKLSMPIAVYPRRLTDRLKAQSGVFTLYGGKPHHPAAGYSRVVMLSDHLFPSPKKNVLYLKKINDREIKAHSLANGTKETIKLLTVDEVQALKEIENLSFFKDE